MGTVAIDELPKGSVASTITNTGVPVDDAQNIGVSNPISYTPPAQEQPNIIDRLATGFTRTIAETPQMLGQGLYFLGSNMNPGASKEEQQNPVGNLGTLQIFGDRIARAGLIMSERNQEYIKNNYSNVDDIWSRVGGAVPMVGGLALGALMGFPEVATLATAVAGGTQVGLSSFNALKDNGRSTGVADSLAALVGAGSGSAMAFGIGNFMKATGTIIPQIAKGIINGFTGGAVQSGVTGSLQLATGVVPYQGSDSLKQIMADAVHTGVTFAILGGPLGMHQALVQHNAVKQGFKEMGLTDKQARDAATTTMAHGMHEGLKHVEKEINASKDELGRIQINPLYKQKPIDETGSPRADVLDEPFIPREPSRAEALTSDLEVKKKEYEIIKKDIKSLQTELKGNELDQRLAKLNLTEKAQQQLEQLKNEGETLKSLIDNLKEKLQPKVNPIKDLSVQIQKINQGFRHGKTMTEGEISFVQKEFNKLVDSSDLEPADKAKFRSLLPKIQSEEDFFKALPEVTHRINILEQRAEQREWVKDIKDIDLKKLPVDYQDSLKPILNSFDFTRPSKNKIIERAKTLDFFKRKLSEMEPGAVTADGKPLLSPGEQKALDDASRLSITEMLAEPDGHERLRAIHDMIMSMAYEGKMKNKYLSNLKQRDHETWVNDFLTNFKDPDNIAALDNLEKALKQKNQSPWQWLWGRKDALQQEQMTPELVMDVLGMGDEHQVLHEAYQQKIENQKQAMKALQDIHKDEDIHEALTKRFDLDVPIGDKTKTYKGITGNELLKVYAQSFDEGGLRHLENTFEGKNTLQALLKKTEELYPKQTKNVQEQFEYFRADGYDRLDKVVQAMQGHHMPKVDFYDPIGGSLEDRSGRDLQQDMQLGIKGMMGRAVPESGFTKARVQSKLAFDKFDYYGDLVRNAMDRENYISMAQALRDMNKKFYDPRITTAISDRFGPNMTRIIHKWLKDAAFDGHQNESVSAKILAAIRGSFIGAKIGFNPFSAGKVFSQLSPASDYVGGNWVPAGTRDYILHRAELDKFVDSKSLMMRNRYLRQERDFQNLVESKGSAALEHEKARTQIIKLSMVMHQEADKIVTRGTWLGAYNKAKAQEFLGGDENAAIAAADSAVRYTHPMGGALYLPDIFRGSEFQKAMTTFHGATNRNFNLLLKNNREFKNSPEGYLKYAKTIFSVGLLPAIFLAGLSLHRLPTTREAALETLNQTTGSDIWMGVLTNALMSGREAGATSPWTAPFTDSLTAIRAKKIETKIRYGLATADDLTGLSTSNLFRMATGQIFKPRGHEGVFNKMDESKNKGDDNPFAAGGF